jgi:hypothetical protein
MELSVLLRINTNNKKANKRIKKAIGNVSVRPEARSFGRTDTLPIAFLCASFIVHLAGRSIFSRLIDTKRKIILHRQ